MNNGSLISGSLIGPENTNFYLHNFLQFFINCLAVFFSKSVTWFGILVHCFPSNFNSVRNFPKYFIIILVVFEFILIFCFQLFYFIRIYKQEREDKQFKITKLTIENRKLTMLETHHTLIGDLVLIKNTNINPADILVLCTSDQNNGESYFITNEGSINSNRSISTKRVFKEFFRISKKQIKISKAVEKIQEILSGHVIYDAPSPCKNINGVLKLKKDPKMYVFSEENIILAGTKLCSSW